MYTPSGGGYGSPDDGDDVVHSPPTKRVQCELSYGGSLNQYKMSQESA